MKRGLWVLTGRRGIFISPLFIGIGPSRLPCSHLERALALGAFQSRMWSGIVIVIDAVLALTLQWPFVNDTPYRESGRRLSPPISSSPIRFHRCTLAPSLHCICTLLFWLMRRYPATVSW